MQQEVVKNQKKDLATKPSSSSSALSTEVKGFNIFDLEVDTSDIIIPKILIMHGQSEKVLKGDKSQGELVKSTDWETLAKKSEKIELIFFNISKSWIISDMSGKKPKKVGSMEWTAANDGLPWDYTENGIKMRRDRTYTFYGLLTKDFQEGVTSFPVMISFGRTSFKPGHTIASNFQMDLQKYKETKGKSLHPFARTYKVGVELVAKDDDQFYVFTVESAGQPAKQALVDEAEKWRGDIDIAKKANKLVEHEYDESQDSTSAPAY